jgi:protein-S-isoprenylcysteine O-methyltransferase Ste14
MTGADRPNVVAFPGVLYALAFALVYGLNLVWPLPLLAMTQVARWVGVVLGIAGAILILSGVAVMRRARTNIYPSLPATALVTEGPFRFTRNPLYVALAILFLGLAFEFNTLWGIVVLAPLLLVMHYGVILREERYLEGKFGDPYREYCRKVRRYL